MLSLTGVRRVQRLTPFSNYRISSLRVASAVPSCVPSILDRSCASSANPATYQYAWNVPQLFTPSTAAVPPMRSLTATETASGRWSLSACDLTCKDWSRHCRRCDGLILAPVSFVNIYNLLQVEGSQEALQTRVEATANEVRAFARGYASAVEAHCLALLRRLEELHIQRKYDTNMMNHAGCGCWMTYCQLSLNLHVMLSDVLDVDMYEVWHVGCWITYRMACCMTWWHTGLAVEMS